MLIYALAVAMMVSMLVATFVSMHNEVRRVKSRIRTPRGHFGR